MPGLKVLQIEDNVADARLVRELVREAAEGSIELEAAATLAEGLEKLKTTCYDLVLLDLGLPDAHGTESFDQLHAEMPDMAIIVLSGLDDEEVAIQAMKKGAQDYLVKGEENGRSFVRAMRHAVERRRIRSALIDERDLLRAVIDSLPDHIYVKDREGRFARVNSALVNFLGAHGVGELLGRTDFDLFSRELAQQFHDEEQRIMESGESVVNREACLGGSNGHRHWVLTTKVPFRNRDGVVIGTVGINRDVSRIKHAEEKLRTANTELKRAHQELQEAQLHLVEVEKLQTVGRLAAGVAHEVKNPLAVALRGIEYLSDSPHVAQDPAGAVILQDMTDAIRRAETVIRGMLDFAAPRKLAAAPQNVNAVLAGALLLVKHDFDKHQVIVEKEFDPLLPQCRLDLQKVQEVFINIFENAAHAMSKGGQLTVRTYQKTVTGVGTNVGDRRGYQFGMGADVVVIEVADTGPGIPEDKLQKIFDPFFTTKPAGQGTGLGLTVAKTIVDLHGGTIEVANRREGGVRVVIMFPPVRGEETTVPLIPNCRPAEPQPTTVEDGMRRT